MPSGAVPSPEPVSVLVGENTRIHSQLLAGALKADPRIHVLGAVCTTAEFDALVSQQIPQVIVLSASLDEDAQLGISTLRSFHHAYPNVPVVMLLDSCKRELVLDAFRSGAKGIFSKNDSLETLCKCVLSVHEGQVWASSREVRYVLEALCAAPTIRAVNKQGINLLAPRELEVVQCLAEGLTNREIGKRMGLSQHTVKNYLLRIFDKLGVSNRVELLSLTMSHQSPAPQPRRETPDAPPLLWCHYAAERGVPYAQLLLAELYAEGKSLPQDLVSAFTWYQVSEAMSGTVRDKIHAAKLDLLRSLTPEQVKQARGKAEDWLRRNAPADGNRTKSNLKPPRTPGPDQRLAVGS